MARAGFWLKGAKGKLAGASIGKGSNGGTVIREVVTPKNPKTEKQMYQRAVMATVMRAYSAGKEILNHSFQGKAVGPENQRRFISLNARRLREQLAQDLNAIKNGTADYEYIARCVSQGAVTSTPFDMQVSEGTYPQTLFIFNPAPVQEGDPGTGFHLKAVTENETAADYATRNGLIAGDIYTLVAFLPHKAEVVYEGKSGEVTDTLYNTEFAFVRLIAKQTFPSDTLATIGQLFNVEKSANVVGSVSDLNISAIFDCEFFTGADNFGGIACIRSREDEDLRSTSYLNLITEDGDWGLAAPYILAAWPSTEQVGNSELILEGGNF